MFTVVTKVQHDKDKEREGQGVNRSNVGELYDFVVALVVTVKSVIILEVGQD